MNTKRWQALGRLPKGTMNKTEAAYASLLEDRRRAGFIHDWKFHAIKVRLADNTFYETDFLVVAANMGLEIHEVKGGFTSDKGQLKIKLCAETLPWIRIFKATKGRKGEGFLVEEYSAK